MNVVRRIVARIGKEGMTGIAMSSPDRRVTITPRASDNFNQLLPTKDESRGSAEGTLETVSIHRGSRFMIYHSRTKNAIRSDIPPDSKLLDQAKEALGSRVLVAGLVHTNARGEPIRISAETLRILSEAPALPSIASLGGKYPDLTGDLTTEEYVRSLRDR